MKKIFPVFLIIVLALFVVVLGWYAWRTWRPPIAQPPSIGMTPSQEEVAVREVVENFGEVLKNVPLSGSRDTAVQGMDEHYRGYVSASLLQRWKSDPAQAIGRLTSSPWPDRIEIIRIERQAVTRYLVIGEIVSLTSAGEAARERIELRVEDVGNVWLITEATIERLVTPPPWKTFVRAGEFSLRYPAEFGFATGTGGGANLDEPLARIDLPNGLFNHAGTNYVEAYAVVSRSTKPEIVHACLSFGDTRVAQSLITSMRSNGIEFKMTSTTEAAAGNIYDSELYRTTHESRCYELALVVHTGNAANYDPPVGEFDRNIALDPLRDIFKTFEFEVK